MGKTRALTRRERRHIRRQLGSLKNKQVSEKSLKNYRHAMKLFFAFLEQEGTAMPDSIEDLDEVLAEFIDDLWLAGESLFWAQSAIAALPHLIPRMRYRCTAAARQIKTWKKYEMPNCATPATAMVTDAIAACLVLADHFQVALGCVLTQRALLRIGETLGILVGHCDIGEDKIIINLGWTKTAKRSGIPEQVLVRDPQLMYLLKAWVHDKSPGDRLFKISSGHFRRLLAEAIRKLRLDKFNYHPHSFRRGGATAMFLATGSYETVAAAMRCGPRNARLYVNEAMAETPSIHLSEKQWSRIKLFAAHWGEL